MTSTGAGNMSANWSSDPPWVQSYESGETNVCGRCGQSIPPYWRHYWAPCRRCNVWSFAGTRLMVAFGLDPTGQMYRGARPWCGDCEGTGYLPCRPQDLSILRMSGVCAVCQQPAFKLIHATDEDHSDVEGSERHFDEEHAGHPAVVVGGPLVQTIEHYLTEASA